MGVFLDLEKTLDIVYQKILIDKFFKYGIWGNILNGFKSYLTNRKQYVHLQYTNSEMETVSCGVPRDLYLDPYYLFYL